MKPRLLDLFCGATERPNQSIRCKCEDDLLRVLRLRGGGGAQDQEVLFVSLRSAQGQGLAKATGLPALRNGVRGSGSIRCESTALLKGLRQEPQRTSRLNLASRAPRCLASLRRDAQSEEPSSLAREVAEGALGDHRSPRGWMRCLRCVQPGVASCRLHSHAAGREVQAPTPCCLRPAELEPVSPALCQPPLRDHPDGADRGQRHHPVARGLA